MANHHSKAEKELVQEEILLDDPNFLKEIVRRVLQQLLETEMTEHIGAAPYQRTEDRKGQRNGYKPRTLKTRVGKLELLVPQDREGTFSTRLFARYQRNEKALVLALMEMYVEGVSTRKVKEVTEELCGTSFSKSLVSRLAEDLDSELKQWRERPLTAKAYPYLFVDARYEKVRVGSRVISEGVLMIVTAVRDDGQREILVVQTADTESGDLSRAVPLAQDAGPVRGRVGDLRRSSGARGGHRTPLPGSLSWQRCQVHYARNLLRIVPFSKREELAAGLREVFAAPTRKMALGLAEQLADRWRKKGYPKVAEHLEEHVEECLSCLAFPESHRKRIRTTNWSGEAEPGDKAAHEGGVRIFPNREACLRLVTALAVEQSEEWVTGRCYLNIDKLEEQRLEERRRGGSTNEEMSEVPSWRKLQNFRDLTANTDAVGFEISYTRWRRKGRTNKLRRNRCGSRLGKKLGHRVEVGAGQRILATPHYPIIESHEEIPEALDRFGQPASVSYTDCMVMALADRLGTKLIFGFDEVFRKNGYRLPAAPKNQQAA